MPSIPDRYNRDSRTAFVKAAASRYDLDDNGEPNGAGTSRLVKSDRTGLFLAKSQGAVVRTPEGETDEKAILTYAITTNAIDRDNDIVDPAGLDIRNFDLNGPILWGHDHCIPNIGRGRSPRLAEKTATGHRGILLDVEFHLVTELSRELYAMAKGGYLNAGSIGFLPLMWTEKSAEAYEDAYPYIDTVRTYTKWELLEFSLCNVPMNPTALLQDGSTEAPVEEDSVRRAIEAGVIRSDAEVINLLFGKQSVSVGSGTPFRVERTGTTNDGTVLWTSASGTPAYAPSWVPDPSNVDTSFIHRGEFDVDENGNIHPTAKTHISPSDNSTPPIMTDSNPTPVDPVAVDPTPTPVATKGLAEEIAGGDAGEAIAAEHQALVDEIFAALTAYEENEDPTAINELPIAYTSAGERVVAILSTAIGLDGEETEEETDEEAPAEETPATEEESVSRTIDSISRALTRIREKKGAVLSKPNKAALSEASKLINGVLAQAETEDDSKSMATPDILSALAELTKRLDRIAPPATPALDASVNDEPVEDLTAYLS